MCGIVGIIDKQDKKIKNRINNMLGIIYKRGPDGEGCYSENGLELAMRRLSIIDLEGGTQPFYSNDKQIVAFQNGEIYNYQELREELKHLGSIFKSHSDTEVIAHGYDKWGLQTLLEKLEGMYAISIYDKRKNKLFLIRDRFGEKPLYYSIEKNNKRFAYASDLRAVLSLEWVDKTYSTTALSRYLMLGFTTGRDSIIENIKKVPPAHCLELELDSFETKEFCYYTPNTFKLEIESDKKEELLHQKLINSIDIRLRADVPVGIFLSGGIDSSVIAALAAQKHNKIDTFSMGFHSDVHDESKYAKEVAKHINSNHHHFMFDENSFVELLPTVVSEIDEPLADQAMLPTFWLSKEARKYVTVVLSGEGGDEVFGGYGYYTQFREKNLITNIVSNQGITPSGFPMLMSIDSCKHFMSDEFEIESRYEKDLINFIEVCDDGIQKAMLTDLMNWLPDDLLVKLDRMAMANSLEGRAPYLSHHIVDFMYGLSQNDWIRGQEYKILLRKVGKKYLPDSIFNRPKQGFVLPMDEWIKKWFQKETVKRFFYSREILEIDTEKLVKWVTEQLSQKNFNQRLIFALIVLYEWHKVNLLERL